MTKAEQIMAKFAGVSVELMKYPKLSLSTAGAAVGGIVGASGGAISDGSVGKATAHGAVLGGLAGFGVGLGVNKANKLVKALGEDTEAANILKMFKNMLPIEEQGNLFKTAKYDNVAKIVETFAKHPYLYTAGAGAVGGGAIGTLAGVSDEGSPLKGAAIGALLGAGAGAGIVAGPKYIWNTIDPRNRKLLINKLKEMNTVFTNPAGYRWKK